MKLSYNWLKEYIDLDKDPEELAEVLTKLGLEVEETIDYNKIYEGFITAKVIKKESHPNADKLSLCTVKYKETSQTVICGAPNVEPGQTIVLGLAGAIVPAFGFKLEKRKIRGIESNGMICSQAELELGEDSSGIWVLENDTSDGIKLTEYLGLDDIIFDVSITPNKGDCLSHFGIARDLAAYYNLKLKKPKISLNETNESIDYEIEIQNQIDCPRYALRIVKNAKISDSPDWLKARLKSLGLRPINNVVDITNFILMEMGQPLHAFDLDTLKGKKIVVKNAITNQKFKTLDNKERTLNNEMLLICDEENPLAVAGVMGGLDSEITDKTQNILIESAYFNPSSIRKTSKILSINSDAAYRYERGVDIENIPYCADRAAQLIAELTGGEIIKGLIDNYPQKWTPLKITLRYQRVEKILGIKLENHKIKNIILSLGFDLVEDDTYSLSVLTPSHRHDIEEEIDLIEEIARINNLDNLEASYSSEVSINPEPVPEVLKFPNLRKHLANYLIDKGYNECLTMNQTDPKIAKIFIEKPVEVQNPLGDELSVLRPSIIPSILKVIERNIRYGVDSIKLFEIGKTFTYGNHPDSLIKGIVEEEKLVVALAGKTNIENWYSNSRNFDFYDIKGIFEEIIDFFNLEKIKLKIDKEVSNGFNANSLGIFLGKEKIGSLGEINKELLKTIDLKKEVYCLELCLSRLYKLPEFESKYNPVSTYPGIEWDLAFVVNKSINSIEIENIIKQNSGKYLSSLNLFDVYEGENIGDDNKSLAYKLNFISQEKTLKDDEIDPNIKNIIKLVESKLNAKLRKF